MDSGPYTSGIPASGWSEQESNREYTRLRQLAVLKLIGEHMAVSLDLEKKIDDIFWRMNAIDLEEYLGMRIKRGEKGGKREETRKDWFVPLRVKDPPASAGASPGFAEVMAKLDAIDVEVRRIQKKLGMKQIYGEGASHGKTP